ncbi:MULTISPECIES: hypothetical protein [unclassified Nitratiruptor]|uniref:hypothetical protein n=1 Tax=unclassified Nitratiruptor TaxID=2624044 RepID=UPI0019166A52|nr:MULTISPECIES: hypothetical protein [unclassified Nitratiruptor]BCD60191.1 hypothetical protein NitYY0810_C0956 [Nitratiruptor sp. YY08-10]BCD64320.1 hypothetical protein NitYY0814_C1165 [Nitratiruptor sp. YY08-14]
MQKNNITAIKAAWNFFKGNYALNFGVLAILIVISLLGAIPIVGMLFVLAYSILSLSVQIYFGKALLQVKSEEEMAQVAQDSKIGDLLIQHLHVAAGAFLALFLLSLLFMALMMMVMGMNMHMDMQTMQNGIAVEQEMAAGFMANGILGLVILVIGAFLFYFFPSVMGEVIRSETFNDGFKKVFLLFNPGYWKRCFNKEYFILILIWSLILLGVFMLLIPMSMSIILLPLVLVIAYLLSLYNAGVYVFASEYAKE